jgi:hypothetical protein
MELMIDNPTYTIIFFLLIICLSLVPYSANKQLDQPILVYGGVFLSIILPLFFPVYLGIMHFKAKAVRLFTYLSLLLVSLALLNFSVSNISKSVTFSELYSGDVTLKEGDSISIEDDFIKLHNTQYVVQKDFKIGGRKETSNHFYYEITPTNDNHSRNIRVFVSDIELWGDKPPSENLINNKPFIGHVKLFRNIDQEVLGKINATLNSAQELVFIEELGQSRYQSNQKISKISSVIFVLFTLIFIVLTIKEYKNYEEHSL